MYTNYIKIALRNLVKHKAFSGINILGLMLGITCSLLIVFWVVDELEVDSFHAKIDRLYGITSKEFVDDAITGSYSTPGLLADELKAKIPEITLASGYGWGQFLTFSNRDKKVKMEGNYAGADFFTMFSYPLLEGKATTALNTRDAVAISEKMATVLYGSPEQAINQLIRFENDEDLRVSAVFANVPDQASEHFDFMLNWDIFVERQPWVHDWHNSGPQTYIVLEEGADAGKVAGKIRTFIARYDKNYTKLDRLELGLQPYSQKYLYSHFENGEVSGGRIEYVRLFAIVAFLILLIACINFMNLSTARSLHRAKEIGIRKVLGAFRPALVAQFLSEAIVYSFLATIPSVLLLMILLPSFDTLVGKTLVIPWGNPWFWAGILGLTLLVGVLAGSYPAFLLSSFKNKTAGLVTIKRAPAAGAIRKGLVIFQFGLSIVFIIGVMVISRQMVFTLNKNLGYQKNDLIYLPITGTMATNFSLFKEKALQLPGIAAISNMSQRPVELDNSTVDVDWEGKPAASLMNFSQLAAGYDFIEAMGADMVLGREFSPDYADSVNYIINETALKKIGYDNPIGRPLTFWGTKGTIVGVVEDFHFNSLHVPIAPLVIRKAPEMGWGYALIRTVPGQTAQALAGLQNMHETLNPEFPFAHQFASEEYAFLYHSEQVAQKVSGYFALLALFISCLGLLGLVLFASEQRAREISIRKVLGAGISSLVRVMTTEFLLLMLAGYALALPIAWLLANRWMDHFAYKAPLNWTFLALLSGTVVFGLAILTSGYQVLRVALKNPVDNLRTE